MGNLPTVILGVDHMLEIGISKYLIKESWVVFSALNSSFSSSLLSCFVTIIFLLLLRAPVVSDLMYLPLNCS